ncbi:MAG: hypothetical protein ACR2NC_04560 [Thermodesulfobacteriota bacterium]
MLKWLISLIVIVFIMTLVFKYSSFITNNSVKRKEDTTSLAEMGKVIKDIREMGKERKKSIKENEKNFGEDQ